MPRIEAKRRKDTAVVMATSFGLGPASANQLVAVFYPLDGAMKQLLRFDRHISRTDDLRRLGEFSAASARCPAGRAEGAGRRDPWRPPAVRSPPPSRPRHPPRSGTWSTPLAPRRCES